MLYLQPHGLNDIIEATLRREINEYNSFVEDRVYKRVTDLEAGVTTSARPDMLHFLLTTVDPDTNLSAFSNREHLLADTKVLTLAGTDTTAESLCALFFYLAHNPSVLVKLTNEVRSTFSSLEQISLSPTLSRCVYLWACIDEAMRLNHPAPGELPREVLSGGVIIDGLPCPTGTVVGCAGWSMDRDESVYGDADTYRPERWIPSPNGPSKADVHRLKQAFHPFFNWPHELCGTESCYPGNATSHSKDSLEHRPSFSTEQHTRGLCWHGTEIWDPEPIHRERFVSLLERWPHSAV